MSSDQSTVSGNGGDVNPYEHCIPGIPTDGKVVLLKNSKLGSEVYLVGTVHISEQSAETVRKVINYVSPNIVAVELCAERAKDMNRSREDVTLFNLICQTLRVPGGLRTKFVSFAMSFSLRQKRADGKLPGLEFKVAVEEASRVGASCALIDQDINITLKKVAKVSSWKLLWSILRTGDYEDTEYTRSYVQKDNTLMKKHYPKIFKALTGDRDKFMFENLRTFEKKVVAVVGIAHLDGIELLWKHAEEGDKKQLSITSENEG